VDISTPLPSEYWWMNICEGGAIVRVIFGISSLSSFGIGIFSISNILKTTWRRRPLVLSYQLRRRLERELKFWAFRAQVRYSEGGGHVCA
jgi:hypothetical protein